MTKLCHVELYVSDYRKSIIFYDMVLEPLGWKRLVCQKSHTTYTDGHLKIVLCPTEDEYKSFGYHRKRTGLNHLAFYAASKEAVDNFQTDVLRKNAIPCLYGEKPQGDDDYYAVYFEDPDRIKIEVVFAPAYCTDGDWSNKLVSDFDPYEAKAPE